MADEDKALNHAWSYFALHANQRITVFNYFVVFAGLLCTGIAAAVQASQRLAGIGVALGFLLTLLAFVFWKLDQRAAFLVKHAEQSLRRLEPRGAPLVASEESETDRAKREMRIWTYGRAFRTIFVAMGLIGFAGSILAASRAFGLLDFGEAKAPPNFVPNAPSPSGSSATLPPDVCGNRCTDHKPTPQYDKKTSSPAK